MWENLVKNICEPGPSQSCVPVYSLKCSSLFTLSMNSSGGQFLHTAVLYGQFKTDQNRYQLFFFYSRQLPLEPQKAEFPFNDLLNHFRLYQIVLY